MYGKGIKLLASFLLILLVLSLAANKRLVKSAADHIVISEIQVTGGSANDEFVELYNPTGGDVNISGWSIQRENTGGAFEKKNFVESSTVPAHGYYLVAHNDHDDSTVSADMSHASFTLSSTGATVFLVNDQVELTTGDEESIIDKVAIGSSALDAETSPYGTIPGTNESIERKACVDSTSESMANGDSSSGNAEDTGDNSADFVSRSTPQPQNSQSSTETPDCAEEPTVTPTTEPTPTDTVTPTPTETVTPTPTETVTPTPTETVTPTPTEEPTPTPTTEPTPTVEPTPTPEGRVIARFGLSGRVRECRIDYQEFRIGFLKVFFPRISCSRV